MNAAVMSYYRGLTKKIQLNSLGNEKVKLIDSLGICGCGTPEPVYEMVRCVLEEIFEEGVNIDRANEDPQYLYVIYMLNHQGFLEHGSSVFGSFPTEKRKEA